MSLSIFLKMNLRFKQNQELGVWFLKSDLGLSPQI